MTLFKKLTVISVSALFLLLVLAIFFSITGGVVGSCSEVELSRAESPTGEYEAIVLQKDCGATTPVAFHVQLSRSDTHQTESVFIVESSFQPSTIWGDTSDLKIIFLSKDGVSVFKKLVAWEKVKIIYKTE